MEVEPFRLLSDDDLGAVVIERPGATSYLFVCDQAGNRIPRRRGKIGLQDDDLQRPENAEDDERRLILRDVGDSALDEHAPWILMHREHSLDPGEIWCIGR